ncbi:efflux RND transporter periplasmic adaptor subunit [Burkholderia oklahomensis]|uniref:efflux RND transporter periplasmic adaptor subunit n=1 Tax=Burkholderia oklahomensis TaxID=342113 RepID=UPI0005D834C8|nr:efflux RND transporter periplasmic adaptor subunit [Burkholderia oklahomensis]AJX33493.1 efflux transporter, RND family, MFP subunit [Burkholderia oklahomensis C6786]AOI45661.1 hypothetical protein WI23_07570 [Burkholderia oklahomensis C6786]KUY64841.1 hypothetical protein WI23_06100 [Burkholderia oklahomensis C6786]SUW56162.1 Multidrug resistance protein MdtE precursor [Burkholderia oklahomensis]
MRGARASSVVGFVAALAAAMAALAGGCGPSRQSEAHPVANRTGDQTAIQTADHPEHRPTNPVENAASEPAALGVTVVTPELRDWETREHASGSVAAFEEIELTAPGDLPLADVSAHVGDRVRKGQALARFDTAGLAVKRAEAQAGVAEAKARLAQASAQLEGAKTLDATGSISRQELIKTQTQATVGVAQLASARARLAGVELQLRQAVVRAPDDGVIASRAAIEGAAPAAGATLFKLIRGGRLEWRAQMGAGALAAIRPGQPAEIVRADGGTTLGTVRQVSPVLDKTTLTGIVYVDLPADSGLRAGSFVSGAIVTGRTRALTLPDSAVLARDGFHYAWTIDAHDRVHPVKLVRGRAQGRRVEVLAGLRAGERVVASGAGLLDDGDTVTIVATAGPADAPARVAPNGGRP